MATPMATASKLPPPRAPPPVAAADTRWPHQGRWRSRRRQGGRQNQIGGTVGGGHALRYSGRHRFVANASQAIMIHRTVRRTAASSIWAARLIPRVDNNDPFDGPRWFSGHARRGPRDGCPSGKRRNAAGKPPRATEGRPAQRAKVVAGCAGRRSWGRLTWGRTKARPAPIQRRKSSGQMGHY